MSDLKENLFRVLDFVLVLVLYFSSLSAVSYLVSDGVFDVEVTYVNNEKMPYSVYLEVDSFVAEELEYDVEVIYRDRNLVSGSKTFECEGVCEVKVPIKKVFFDRYDVLIRTEYDGKFYEKKLKFDLDKKETKNKIVMKQVYFYEGGSGLNVSGKLFVDYESEVYLDVVSLDDDSVRFRDELLCENVCDFEVFLNSSIVFGKYSLNVYLPNDVLSEEFHIRYGRDVDVQNVGLNRNKSGFGEARKVDVDFDVRNVRVVDVFGRSKVLDVKNGSVDVLQGYGVLSLDDSRENVVRVKPEVKSVSNLKEIQGMRGEIVVKRKGFSKFDRTLGVSGLSDSLDEVVLLEEKIYSSDLKSYFDLQDNGSLVDVFNQSVRKLVPGVYKYEKVVSYRDGTQEVEENYFAYGLISINTLKPLYHDGEVIEFLVVVLDKYGFLVSDANISLDVSLPDGDVLSLSSADFDIVETEKVGVYAVSMIADDVGEYGLYAQVELDEMVVDVESYFNVVEEYPFDILRDVPATIDPWEGPFENKFRVEPIEGYEGRYDFVEVFSSDFDVVESDADEVVYDDDSIYLIWEDLKGESSLFYVAQTPLVTPYLYYLGKSKVIYGEGSEFYENRSWLFAIDPAAKECGFNSACICGAGCRVADGTNAPSAGAETIDGCSDGDKTYEYVDDVRVTDLNGSYFGVGDTVEICVDYNCDTVFGGDRVTIGYKDSGAGWVNGDIILESGNSYSGTACVGIQTYCVNQVLSSFVGIHNVRAKIVWSRGGGLICDNGALYRDHDDVNFTVLPKDSPSVLSWNLTNGTFVGDGLNVTWGNNVTAFVLWDMPIQEALIRHNGNVSFVDYGIFDFSGNYTNYTLDTSDLSEFSYLGVVNISYVQAWEFFFNETNQTDSRYLNLYGTPMVSDASLSPYVIYNNTNVTVGCSVEDEFMGLAYDGYVVDFYHSLDGFIGSNVTNVTGDARYSFLEQNPVGNYTIVCNISSNLTGYAIRSKIDYFKNQTLVVRPFGADISPPVVNFVSAAPSVLSIGGVVSVIANVTDDVNLVDVFVDVSLPNSTVLTFSMANVGGDMFEFNFSDTSEDGVYEYFVYGFDNSSNKGWSPDYSFEVVGIRTFIGIKSTKDVYKIGESINLTSYVKSSLVDVVDYFEMGDVGYFWYDFDTSWDGWTSGGAANEWERGVPGTAVLNQCDNSNCLAIDLNANYNTNANQWAQSPVMDFTGRSNVKVDYWRMLEVQDGTGNDRAYFEGFDGGAWNVYFQDSLTGSNPYVLGAGSSTFYVPELDGVSNARIRFRLTSDGSGFNVYEGWAVDSVNVSYDSIEDWDKPWSTLGVGFGVDYDKITAVKISVNVTDYDSSGSVVNQNLNPDLEFQVYNGTGYSGSYLCNLDSSKSYPYVCEFVIKNMPEYMQSWNESTNRLIRFRAIDLDDGDYLNWTDVSREVVTPSIIENHGIAQVTSFLLQQFLNSTGGVVQTMYFSPVSINASMAEELSNYWSFSVPGGFKLGNYSAYVALTDAFGNVLQNDDDFTFINDSDIFEVASLIINPEVPQLGGSVLESFFANISLDISSYGSGGWCAYSLDGTPNVSMSQVGPVVFNTSMFWNFSDGEYSLTYYCNDTDDYMVSSEEVRFNVSQPPRISFVDPTNVSGVYVNRSWVQVNVSVEDSSNTSAYLDFDGSLVGYWNFENASAAIVYDYSSYGNSGGFANGANVNDSFVDMIRGKYGEFDGANDYVSLGDLDAVDGVSELSVSAWIRVDDLNKDNDILTKGSHSTGTQILFWRDEVGAVSGRTNTLAVLLSDGSGDVRLEAASNVLNDNDWHHVVFTYEGGSSTGLRLYVDGVEDVNGPVSTIGTESLLSTGNSLLIGRPTGSVVQSFDGLIDEVLVYDRVIGADEVRALYDSNVNNLYVNVSGLLNAAYDYFACAIDRVGNMNCTETRVVNINKTIAVINITSPEDGRKYFVDEAIWLNVSTSIDASSILCEFDGNGTVYSLTNLSYTNWTAGSFVLRTGYHSVVCLGDDDAGNSLIPVSHNFTVLPDKYFKVNKSIISVDNLTYYVNITVQNNGTWENVTVADFVDSKWRYSNFTVFPDDNFSVSGAYFDGTIFVWNVSLAFSTFTSFGYYISAFDNFTNASLGRSFIVGLD